ncbi:MAG: radical SAM protein [Pseudomonadota bacterium]
MKSSMFNLVFDHQGSIYCFNTASGALLPISGETKKIIKGKKIHTDQLSVNYPDLVKGRFFVPPETDEIKKLRFKYESQRFNTSILALTVCPTLSCNFACPYCFESPSIQQGYMSEETINCLIQFLEAHLPSKKSLLLTWFGGEPLLGLSIIDRLSKTIIELCEKNEVEYSSSIITNGYLLNRENAETLLANQITRVQVTIDGTENVHNATRSLKNGKGTFNRIITNVLCCKDILDVAIRINLHNKNAYDMDKLIAYLAEKGLANQAYVDRVTDEAHSNRCLSCDDFTSLSIDDFSKYETRALNVFANQRILDRKLKPKPTFCAATTLSMFVLDPAGNIFKCWHSVGNIHESIGNIHQESIELNENHIDWLSYLPYDDDKCCSCICLPICQGGCIYQKILGVKVFGECDSIRSNLVDTLRIVIDNDLNSTKLSHDNVVTC